MIYIIAPLEPKNSAKFPITDALYIKGGFMAVDTLTTRNAIHPSRRSEGMLVWVNDENKSYRLSSDITNSGWVEIGNDLKNYVHSQSVASSSWTINHNLGFIPNVSIINASGNILEGNINHTSVNTTLIYFNNVYTGTGYLS